MDQGLLIDSNMFHFRERPFNLLLMAALFILVTSFFVSGQTLNIHLHDTYYIIETALLFRVVVVLLLIFWLLHLLTRRLLFSGFLVWVQVILIMASSVLLVSITVYSNSYNKGLAGMPRYYSDQGIWGALRLYSNFQKGVMIAFLLMSLGLFTYLVNLMARLFRKLV